MQDHNLTFVSVDRDVDVTDRLAVYDCLRRHNPDAVIHCAAITDVPGCETNKQLAYDVNYRGTCNVAYAAAAQGTFMVSISTDYVFRGDKKYAGDGLEGNYETTDFVDPINYYAFTKVLAEQATLAIMGPENCLVPRLSFKNKGPWPYPKAFIDQYTSRDTVDVIARQILNACLSHTTGIVHLGTHRKTVFELAQRQSPDVEQISIEDIHNVILPRDTSLKLTQIPEVL